MAFLLPDAATVLSETLSKFGAAPAVRVPIVWQSTWRDNRGVPPIMMKINPQQVQFQQGKRIQKQDTIGGVTYFHFSNQNGQNNDILILSISGTTGNIDPRSIQRQVGQVFGADLTFDKTGALEKLKAWASFYQLTLEPIVDLETGRPNLVTLTYASTLFPKPIMFIGFFMNVLQFTETAQEPFQRQWNVQFIVQRTDPGLDTIVDYLGEHIIDSRGLNRLASIVNIGPIA